MKKIFHTLWKNEQAGFISIPILIIAILGSVVVGGGSYAVYKVNKVEQESSSRVTELERKFEEVSKPATATEVIAESIATTSLTENIATSVDENLELISHKNTEIENSKPVPTLVSQETNFNAVAIVHWQSEVRLSEKLLPSAELMLSKMTAIKNELEKLRVMVSNEADDAIDAPTEDLLDQTAKSIREDISNTEMYIDFLSNYVQEIKNNIAYSNQQLALAQNSFYTRADFDSFKVTHQSKPTFSETSGSDVFAVWDEFLQYRNGRDNDYRSIFELVIERNKQLQVSYNSYISSLQQIPKIELPKTQATNCTIIDNMVNCETRY